MIGVSSKGNYSIIIVLELAKAFGKNLVNINMLSKSKNIPRSYLIQLFSKLRQTGLIESIRGSKGGYKLAFPPEKITMLDVLEKVDGEFEMFHNYPFDDAIRAKYSEVENAVKTILGRTFSEIIVDQDMLDKKVMYYI